VAICLLCRGHRELPWFADHRDVEGLQVEPSLDGIPDHGPQEAEPGTGRAALDAPGEAVERDLRDHGNDSGVVGGDRDDMRAAQGVAPQRHPVGVEVVTAPNPGDGGPEVVVLTGEVDDLARLAAALTEAAIVEDQGGDAAGGEPFGMGNQPVQGAAEAVGEDDTWQSGAGVGLRFGMEQVAGTGHGAGCE
jgi:hypothetical protein